MALDLAATEARLDRRAKRLGMVKNCFEIFVFLCAGLWAIYIFKLKDAPSTNKSFKVNNSIKIDNFSEDKANPSDNNFKGLCYVTYKIDVKNIGIADAYIDSVEVKLFQVETDSISSNEYIDFQYLSKQDDIKPLATSFFDDGDLSGYYPPDTEGGETYDFKVPIDYNKAVVVTHKIFGHGKDGVFSKKNLILTGESWRPQTVADKKDVKEKEKVEN